MNRELLILNRALPIEYGADEMPRRIHIVPRGELVNKDAGVTQVFDDKSIDAIFTDLVENKARNGGLYMGEEHFIYDPEKSSQAFSWAKNFEKDSAGIWAISPEHTDVGLPAIKNKRFKWTSLVADPAQAGVVENLGGGKIRVLKIDTVGYTNYPNGKNLLAPISNRPGAKSDDASSSAAASNQQQQQKQTMKNIAVELGLDPNTDENGILAALRPLKNRGDISAADLAILRNEHKTFGEQNQTLLGEQVDGILAEHKITDTKIVNRLKPVLLPLANRAERLTFLADLGHKPEAKAAPAATTGRVLNRGTASAAATQAGSNAAVTTAASLNDEVRKVMNRDRSNFDTAFNVLRREKPELFAAPIAQDE